MTDLFFKEEYKGEFVMRSFTKKDLASVLHTFYIENYCETDFSFDEGKLRKEIDDYFIGLGLSHEEYDDLMDKVIVDEREGTDYDYFIFSFDGMDKSELFLQVTSLIDYYGNKVEGYKGDEEFADVGMFFIGYENIDFNDIDDKKQIFLEGRVVEDIERD